MRGFIIVFIGGGIGTAIRHGVNLVLARGSSFPFHTLFENVSGSFLMGLVAGYFAFRGEAPQEIRLFLTTGILGGYTTFSAFSLETMLLWERGSYAIAAVNVVASVACSLLGLWLGLYAARKLT